MYMTFMELGSLMARKCKFYN